MLPDISIQRLNLLYTLVQVHSSDSASVTGTSNGVAEIFQKRRFSESSEYHFEF